MRPRESDFDIEADLLIEAILRKYQYDFRHYARASVRRRLEQALASLGLASVSLLQDRVLRDPEVFARLLSFLTVQVSDLFRDPAFFQAVRSHVVPLLHTYPSPRAWVAGCANGEEAYSLAILLEEEGLLDRALIYATDINPEALRRAEAGVYSLDRAPAFSESYSRAGGKGSLSDHYTAAYGGIVFNKRLRSKVLFSDHSLATDAVFAEVHLVMCRNVLIYFDRPLQDRAIGLFREALVRKGVLGLGSKETLRFSSHADAFTELVASERLYQRT